MPFVGRLGAGALGDIVLGDVGLGGDALPAASVTQLTVEVAYRPAPPGAQVTQETVEVAYLVPIIGPEFDVRLYDGSGNRMHMPREWVETVDFEIGEDGGYLNGTLKLAAQWTELPLVGNERIDVWIWGDIQYRGWIRLPSNELADPQSKTLGLYGLVEKLNGYMVRRKFAFAANTDIGEVFRQLVDFYARRPDRLPTLIIDTVGVAALDITLTEYDASGKNLTQALTDLAAMSPASLVWGCGLNVNHDDIIYLKPRGQTVKYKYSVGDKVQAFIYPRDETRIVNALQVTGGTQQFPNLAPNASFEDSNAAGELTANLLGSPSFEDASGGTIPNWGTIGNPTSAPNPRTGDVSVNLDNNPTTPEGVYQDVYVGALPLAISWAVYARTLTASRAVKGSLQLLNHANVVLASTTFGPTAVPTDGQYYRFNGSWVVPNLPGAERVRYTIEVDQPGSGSGIDIDDAALWWDSVLAAGWAPGRSYLADFAILDWTSRDIQAYDGDISVKVQPTILGGGGYAEIATTPNGAISVHPRSQYVFGMFVSGDVVSPPSVALGVRGYKQGSINGAASFEAAISITSGLWHWVTANIWTGDSDALDLAIRFYNGNLAYIDAAGLWANGLPAMWYPADKFYARRDVRDYAGTVSADAEASITTYGIREADESNDNVIDQATLDAFAVAYFNANAVPLVQGELTLFGPTAPLLLDGMVQLVNLPSEPPALYPTRVRYKIADAIVIAAELGNQRPDMAALLRAAAQRRLT